MAKILLLNGPNLNMLGTREPEIYGAETLADITQRCQDHATSLGITLECRQSNHEGELVDWIQTVTRDYDGIIINAGGFTHTSVAIHDALMMLDKPIIELHLSNIFARESFRHHSYISKPATGVICGFGAAGYGLALDAMKQLLTRE